MAIASEKKATTVKKADGGSNIVPPGDRPDVEGIPRQESFSVGRARASQAPAAPAAPRGGNETARPAGLRSGSTSRRSVRPARRPRPADESVAGAHPAPSPPARTVQFTCTYI